MVGGFVLRAHFTLFCARQAATESSIIHKEKN